MARPSMWKRGGRTAACSIPVGTLRNTGTWPEGPDSSGPRNVRRLLPGAWSTRRPGSWPPVWRMAAAPRSVRSTGSARTTDCFSSRLNTEPRRRPGKERSRPSFESTARWPSCRCLAGWLEQSWSCVTATVGPRFSSTRSSWQPRDLAPRASCEAWPPGTASASRRRSRILDSAARETEASIGPRPTPALGAASSSCATARFGRAMMPEPRFTTRAPPSASTTTRSTSSSSTDARTGSAAGCPSTSWPASAATSSAPPGV